MQLTTLAVPKAKQVDIAKDMCLARWDFAQQTFAATMLPWRVAAQKNAFQGQVNVTPRFNQVSRVRTLRNASVVCMQTMHVLEAFAVTFSIRHTRV